MYTVKAALLGASISASALLGMATPASAAPMDIKLSTDRTSYSLNFAEDGRSVVANATLNLSITAPGVRYMPHTGDTVGKIEFRRFVPGGFGAIERTVPVLKSMLGQTSLGWSADDGFINTFSHRIALIRNTGEAMRPGRYLVRFLPAARLLPKGDRRHFTHAITINAVQPPTGAAQMKFKTWTSPGRFEGPTERLHMDVDITLHNPVNRPFEGAAEVSQITVKAPTGRVIYRKYPQAKSTVGHNEVSRFTLRKGDSQSGQVDVLVRADFDQKLAPGTYTMVTDLLVQRVDGPVEPMQSSTTFKVTNGADALKATLTLDRYQVEVSRDGGYYYHGPPLAYQFKVKNPGKLSLNVKVPGYHQFHEVRLLDVMGRPMPKPSGYAVQAYIDGDTSLRFVPGETKVYADKLPLADVGGSTRLKPGRYTVEAVFRGQIEGEEITRAIALFDVTEIDNRLIPIEENPGLSPRPNPQVRVDDAATGDATTDGIIKVLKEAMEAGVPVRVARPTTVEDQPAASAPAYEKIEIEDEPRPKRTGVPVHATVKPGGSLWRSIGEILASDPAKFGFKGEGDPKSWIKRTTSIILHNNPDIARNDLIHAGDTVTVAPTTDGLKLFFKPTSGQEASSLSGN
ncbi:hypothetical protein JYT83_00730 [bacterium AH-315-F18]|nr:hypothetical protein [bacterium AH-315-F18]